LERPPDSFAATQALIDGFKLNKAYQSASDAYRESQLLADKRELVRQALYKPADRPSEAYVPYRPTSTPTEQTANLKFIKSPFYSIQRQLGKDTYFDCTD